jgi:undecaprenyl diphosphate synthase
MDGNGRWAQSRGLPRWRGHLSGVRSVRSVVRAAPELGVSTLTLYAFSCDNWSRPRTEIGRLFDLLAEYCVKERAKLVERGVRVSAIGRRDRIPARALKALEELESATLMGETLHLRLAIDYSSRAIITQATRALSEHVRAGAIQPHEIEASDLDRLITGGVSVPDLLVRTAGEQRLSDFLLWECAYAELYFTERAWPEFRGEHLAAALADFRSRERRFGGLTPIQGAESPQERNRLVG